MQFNESTLDAMMSFAVANISEHWGWFIDVETAIVPLPRHKRLISLDTILESEEDSNSPNKITSILSPPLRSRKSMKNLSDLDSEFCNMVEKPVTHDEVSCVQTVIQTVLVIGSSLSLLGMYICRSPRNSVK